MLKGVKSRGLRQLELAHTTKSRPTLPPTCTTSPQKTWRLKTKSPKSKKVCPSPDRCPSLGRIQEKNYTTMFPKKQKCHWTQNFWHFQMNLNPMPSPKTDALYVWQISHSILSVQLFTCKRSGWTNWIRFDISGSGSPQLVKFTKGGQMLIISEAFNFSKFMRALYH